jgi:hypothetical protein
MKYECVNIEQVNVFVSLLTQNGIKFKIEEKVCRECCVRNGKYLVDTLLIKETDLTDRLHEEACD